MTLILVGYMGSGKSSVGKRLAHVLKYDFIDLDQYIESKVHMDVKSIFKTKGEIGFRKLESQYLEETSIQPKTVLALGGGTPCYGDNLNRIKQHDHSIMIYLKSSISHLTDRLFSERDTRPLISHLKTKQELSEFIGKHLFERAPYYEQSDIVIKTDDLSIEEIVALITLQLF